jgi:hypothetical protein
MTQAAPSNTFAMSAGFAYPVTGGTLAAMSARVTYLDTGTNKALFTLPRRAVMVAIIVNVVTAFNGDTTNTLDLGVAGSTNGHRNDLSLAAVGQTVTGWTATVLNTPLSGDMQVLGSVVSTASASAGDAYVTYVYYLS